MNASMTEKLRVNLSKIKEKICITEEGEKRRKIRTQKLNENLEVKREKYINNRRKGKEKQELSENLELKREKNN